MGERKVLNKYIPADFDPKLVPRGSKPKDDLVPVRMMLPFSIQCSSCSSFMYRGTKFNSKKEPMGGPEGKYLGTIQRYRFYIKCSVCSRPITFLTDPQNTDYEMESGATRNYEVWKDRTKFEDLVSSDKQQEEKMDPMKALENRVLDSQREMAELDNLDEIRAMNMMHQRMLAAAASAAAGGGGQASGSNKNGAGGGGGFDDSARAVMMAREMAHKHHRQEEEEAEEELNENGLTASEEAMVKSIKFGTKRKGPAAMTSSAGGDGSGAGRAGGGIRRLGEEDEEEFEKRRRKEEDMLRRQQAELAAKAKNNSSGEEVTRPKPLVPVIKVKRRKLANDPSLESKKKSKVEKRMEQNKELEGNNKRAENVVTQTDSVESDRDDEGSGGDGLGGLLGGYDSVSDSE